MKGFSCTHILYTSIFSGVTPQTGTSIVPVCPDPIKNSLLKAIG
tara:strand:- start:189 stop:320 length:132 start_codon:yes stop_codon:yes gene_type:complete